MLDGVLGKGQRTLLPWSPLFSPPRGPQRRVAAATEAQQVLVRKRQVPGQETRVQVELSLRMGARHSFIHSCIHSFTHSFIHSLTHSLAASQHFETSC